MKRRLLGHCLVTVALTTVAIAGSESAANARPSCYRLLGAGGHFSTIVIPCIRTDPVRGPR